MASHRMSPYSTPSATREVLERHGLYTKYGLGQNFLVNDDVIRKIVELADVQPDFEFTEKLEGYDAFMGNGENLAKAVYQKKDGSKITPEEFKAFAEKIYAVTQKLAQDGKVVKGFGSHLDVKTREQALEEISLEKLLADGGSNLEWAFLKDDRFEACYVTMQNTSKSSYVTVSFGEGTQKNLDEALKDAEKYLN